MNKVVSGILAALALVFVLGCNSKPDPKDSPEFNNETYSDPNAVLNTMTPPSK